MVRGVRGFGSHGRKILAPLSAALWLARYLHSVVLVDSGDPRNWETCGINGFLGAHGIKSLELTGAEPIEARRVLLAIDIKDIWPRIPGLEACYGETAHVCPGCDGYDTRHKKTQDRHLYQWQAGSDGRRAAEEAQGAQHSSARAGGQLHQVRFPPTTSARSSAASAMTWG